MVKTTRSIWRNPRILALTLKLRKNSSNSIGTSATPVDLLVAVVFALYVSENATRDIKLHTHERAISSVIAVTVENASVSTLLMSKSLRCLRLERRDHKLVDEELEKKHNYKTEDYSLEDLQIAMKIQACS
jgi:hypothetical protein